LFILNLKKNSESSDKSVLWHLEIQIWKSFKEKMRNSDSKIEHPKAKKGTDTNNKKAYDFVKLCNGIITDTTIVIPAKKSYCLSLEFAFVYFLVLIIVSIHKDLLFSLVPS
jgi:hypothetical protein